MGYVGTAPLSGDYRKLDDISGTFNGDDNVTFNLTVSSVAVTPPKATTMLISVGGILQEPVTAYTISGSTITFTAAPPTGADFFGILLGDATTIGTLADDTVTGAKIVDDAVDSEHIAAGAIDNEHLADDAVDSDEIAAAAVDLANIQNVGANSILGRNANDSGVLSEIALTSAQILIGDGTGFTAAVLSGDASMTNAGAVTVASAAADFAIVDDLSLTSDSAVFNMGVGNDFTITHDGTTGATITAIPLTVTSATAATWSTSAGALTLDGTGGLVLKEGGSAIISISDARAITTANTASIALDASGVIELNSSGGALSIGNDNVDQTINIATAGTRTVNIGIDDGTDKTTINMLAAMHIDSTPANTVYSGITGTFTAGEILSVGECVYLKAADTRMWKAVSGAGGTGLITAEIMCVAVAAEAISAGVAGVFLLQGFITSTAFPTYAIGETLYLPEAEQTSLNVPEGVAVDSTGDFVQVLGWASAANTIFFNPDFTIIEHA
jgi:hypothetical protein